MIRLIKFILPAILISGILGAGQLFAQAEASIRGFILDTNNSTPLPGANLILVDGVTNQMVDATFSNDSGEYLFIEIESGVYTIHIQYVGYEETSIQLQLARGQAKNLDIRLELSSYDLNAVIVTAPWQIEQIVTSTSSTTILDEQEIETEVSLSPVTALRKVAGVDIARSGVDRYEIGIRGFNDYLSTSTQILTDFRNAGLPSIGGNLYQAMPFSQIDIDRIEILRGPGSSLYGSGVESGVVHFVTKSPLSSPGTTIMMSGGQRESFQTALRHAGSSMSGRLGYKIVVDHNQARDWEYNSNDSHDQLVLSQDIAPRDYFNRRTNVYGRLEYLINANARVMLNAGISTLETNLPTPNSATVRLPDAFTSFFHLQFTSGNYFGQAHYSKLNIKDGFSYSAPDLLLSENSGIARIQQQYNFILPGQRGRFIVGADLGVLNPQTDGSLHGRFEEKDDLIEVGFYFQSTIGVHRKLDLTMATRVDYDNINKRFNTGPRLGVVFKPSRKNFIRAFYNKTFATISSLRTFVDLLAVSESSSGNSPLAIRVMGNADGFNYNRNADYLALAGTDLVASSLDPLNFGNPQPVGVEIDPLFNQFYNQLIATTNVLPGFSIQESGLILSAINPANNPIDAFSQGQLALTRNFGEDVRFVDTIDDLAPIRPTSNQTFEIGYKGTLADRFIVTSDLFFTIRENFLGTLESATPLVYASNIMADFQNALLAAFRSNAGLQTLGLTDEDIQQLAAVLTQLADGDSTLSNLAVTPVAIVQPVENPNPGEMVLTSVNFGRITYWGFDASTQIFVSNDLDLFGNISFLSNDIFDDADLGDAGSGRILTINAPKFKASWGLNYRLYENFAMNATMRYSNGFPMITGFFSGEADPYFLVDLGVGYRFDDLVPGLRFDIHALNLFDEQHREFVGAPKIGRFVMARLIWKM